MPSLSPDGAMRRLGSAGDRSGWRVSVQPAPWVCPTCGEPLRFEILDDEAFLVAWSCLNCGLVRVTEPA